MNLVQLIDKDGLTFYLDAVEYSGIRMHTWDRPPRVFPFTSCVSVGEHYVLIGYEDVT